MNEELTLVIGELWQYASEREWFIQTRDIPARSIGAGETIKDKNKRVRGDAARVLEKINTPKA